MYRQQVVHSNSPSLLLSFCTHTHTHITPHHTHTHTHHHTHTPQGRSTSELFQEAQDWLDSWAGWAEASSQHQLQQPQQLQQMTKSGSRLQGGVDVHTYSTCIYTWLWCRHVCMIFCCCLLWSYSCRRKSADSKVITTESKGIYNVHVYLFHI